MAGSGALTSNKCVLLDQGNSWQDSPYLDSYMQLGSALGRAGSLERGPVHFHSHGEDRNMNWASLRHQFVLQAWFQLIKPHQGVHSLGGLSLFFWGWHHNTEERTHITDVYSQFICPFQCKNISFFTSNEGRCCSSVLNLS